MIKSPLAGASRVPPVATRLVSCDVSGVLSRLDDTGRLLVENGFNG
jgi:hypothetical protein